jgi:hypothetical protein
MVVIILIASRKSVMGAFTSELPMQTITTIGFDIAKSVFQVHGVDAAGEVVIRRRAGGISGTTALCGLSK